MKHKLTIKDGIRSGLPIGLGYFPIAMAFGILAKSAGVTLMEALGFSTIVFAGASQFIAVSMIAMQASAMEIVITTFFLNFRHFLMSASLAPKIQFEHWWAKPIISFFVTDESFSVASFTEGDLNESFMIPMQLVPYVGWGSGTVVGHLVGSVLPPLLQQSMGIGLYAMFVALLIPEVKKTKKAIVLSILSGIVNIVFVFGLGVSAGWSIVFSIILVAFLGVLIYYNEPAGDEEVPEVE